MLLHSVLNSAGYLEYNFDLKENSDGGGRDCEGGSFHYANAETLTFFQNNKILFDYLCRCELFSVAS